MCRLSEIVVHVAIYIRSNLSHPGRWHTASAEKGPAAAQSAGRQHAQRRGSRGTAELAHGRAPAHQILCGTACTHFRAATAHPAGYSCSRGPHPPLHAHQMEMTTMQVLVVHVHIHW